MKKRNCSGKEKLEIALEGMTGTAGLAGHCNQHQITQWQFYPWWCCLKEESRIFPRAASVSGTYIASRPEDGLP